MRNHARILKTLHIAITTSIMPCIFPSPYTYKHIAWKFIRASLGNIFYRQTILSCGLLSLALLSTHHTMLVAQDSLTVARFFRIVLDGHPVSRSAILEQVAAQADIQNARGAFDPTVKASYDVKQESSKDKFNNLDASVEMPLATMFGPRISAGYDRNIGSNTNPEGATPTAGYGFAGIKLPVWQNVLTDLRRTAMDKAELRPAIANAIQAQEQNTLLRSAGQQYWSWAEAFAQLRIAQNVFDLAVQRSDFIARRAKAGEIAPLDSIEALQEIERRRGDVLRAQRALEQAGIDLNVFSWTSTGDPLAITQNPQAIIADNLPRLDSARVRAERQAALQVRPELQRIELNAQSINFDINLAREAQKPMVETEFKWLQSVDGNAPSSYKVGLNVSYPIFVRSATAQTELLSINLDRIALQRTQTQRVVLADVDNAISALQRASDRIRAAERETYYAVQMEVGERKRFEAGETSLLFVNLRERAAAEARVRLVGAQADYLRAYITYRWAIGTIRDLAQ